MEPTVFVFHGELISSKNSRRPFLCKGKSGKTKIVIAKSKVAKADEKSIRERLASDKQMRTAWDAEIKRVGGYPICLRFKIYRVSHRHFDYVNIVQNLLDCLVKERYIVDDSAKYILPSFEAYEVDKNNPRTEITILPF